MNDTSNDPYAEPTMGHRAERAHDPFAQPAPAREHPRDRAGQRAAYLARIDEALRWRAGAVAPGEMDLSAVAANLVLGQRLDACSQRVVELMATPGTGPFWMFPSVCVAFVGRERLTAEAQAAIREAWRSFQVRGDTENHWVMYYVSLYLMCELYPDEDASGWYNGKSSAENRAEATEFFCDWVEQTTTIGQGEYNPSQYIGEYAIPLLYLAAWAQDPAMRLRGQLMLDWLFAELASTTLHGVLRGANARTDEGSVVERWNGLVSFFSWLLFGNTPPPAAFGHWGNYFTPVAAAYDVPEVIFAIATDRATPYVQRDLKRTRRRWRYADSLCGPIRKISYMADAYAVGSYQGGMSDPIQTHTWDVTWDVPDPRGVHNTMFSMHPYVSDRAMQTYFTALAEVMVDDVAKEGKPSYALGTKVLGCSPYERVFQDHDLVIALYDIPDDDRFVRVNGLFTKDLVDVTEDPSGWIFGRGGDTLLAYRPLAPYAWEPYQHFDGGWATVAEPVGGQLLVSPHGKNGTIVQAAPAADHADLDAFAERIRALPLSFSVDPVPTVTLQTLRGSTVTFTYDEVAVVDGAQVDVEDWPLFEGPYLNAAAGSRRLEITHGRLRRVIDLGELSATDSVVPTATAMPGDAQ